MKDPAVLFFIDNWLVSTSEMDADCRGWYLNLLLHNYDKESLPNDIEKLAVLCNVKFSEFNRFEQVFEQVLKQKFEQTDDGRLTNPHTKQILQKRKEFKDERSKSGKISYVMRYFSKTFPKEYKNKNIREFVKNEVEQMLNKCSTSVQTKNEQVFKQMFKRLFELYINGNRNIIIDNGKGGMGEKPKAHDDVFEIFRKEYPGTKRGLETEFLNFKKKHKDWEEALPLLPPALENEKQWRKQAKEKKQFVPEWAMLSTWINQRRWEQELNFNFEIENNGTTNKTTGRYTPIETDGATYTSTI